MMKLGLDMEQTVGSPGEEKREKKRGESCFGLVQGVFGVLVMQVKRCPVDKESLRSANISSLCCCELVVIPTHLTDA